jgi:aminoglycoside 2''-phosphotransferase
MNISPEQIVGAVPGLAAGLPSLSIIESGQNSRVFDFGTHIARAGRHLAAQQMLAHEAMVLATIGPMLPVPTPRIEIHRVAGTTIIAVHEKLPGEPLVSIDDLTPDQREHVAADLGSFLRALHAIPLEAVSGLDLPVEDGSAWSTWLALVRTRIYPLLNDLEAERFDARAVAFLESWPGGPGQPKHGDFGSGNILVADGRISGIIDFGSVSIGDPATDVAGLISSYGDGFADLVARTYPEVAAMRPRSAFYRPAFAAMEALHGLDHDDPDALEAGLATLRG